MNPAIAGTSESEDWPMFARDPSRSSYSAVDPPAKAGYVARSNIFSTDRMFVSSLPVVSSGLVLVEGNFKQPPDIYPYGYTYRLYALDLASLEPVWSYEPTLENPAHRYITSGWWNETGPAVIDSKVIVAVYDRVVALDLLDGTELWSHSFPTSPTPAPGAPIADSDLTILPVNVLNGSYHGPDGYYDRWEGSLIALSTETGELRWRVEFGTGLHPAVEISGDIVVATWNGKVCRLERDSGLIEWCVLLEEKITAPPSAGEEYVFIGTYPCRTFYPYKNFASTNLEICPGHLNALHLENGTVAWRVNIEGIPRGPPTVTPSHLYLGTFSDILWTGNASSSTPPFGWIYRLDFDGNVEWARNLSSEEGGSKFGGVKGSISAGPNRIAFVNWDDLEVRSAETGELLWSYPLHRDKQWWYHAGISVRSGPAITSDGIVIMGYPEDGWSEVFLIRETSPPMDWGPIVTTAGYAGAAIGVIIFAGVAVRWAMKRRGGRD